MYDVDRFLALMASGWERPSPVSSEAAPAAEIAVASGERLGTPRAHPSAAAPA
jgi:hypothetical protein